MNVTAVVFDEPARASPAQGQGWPVSRARRLRQTLHPLAPLLGAGAHSAPAGPRLGSQGEGRHAAFLAISGTVVVGDRDSLLRPLLISGRTGLPRLAGFIGVMGGVSAVGIIGRFLSPVVPRGPRHTAALREPAATRSQVRQLNHCPTHWS